MPVPDWSRVANTTIHQYIRDEEVNILRGRKLLSLMKNKGRITFGHSGDFMDWKVRYKRAPMQGYADSDTLTFSRRDRWKTAQLDWRGYAATDQFTKLESLKNRGTEAIIKFWSQIAQNLMDDIEDQFGDELYIDGNASGNSKRLHGIESFMGNSGASGTTGAVVAVPSDTYAGLTTGLGDYGGSWTQGTGGTAWPSATGDAQYDFWSPLLVDYGDADWAASGVTWADTCKEALRFGIIKQKNRAKSAKGGLDLILANDELYRLFEDALDSRERTIIRRGESPGGMYALGFSDIVNWDGVDITYEYGVPAGVAYGLPMSALEMRSLQKQLFIPTGPDEDIASQSFRFSIDFFGNMRFNPRGFVKWLDL